MATHLRAKLPSRFSGRVSFDVEPTESVPSRADSRLESTTPDRSNRPGAQMAVADVSGRVLVAAITMHAGVSTEAVHISDEHRV